MLVQLLHVVIIDHVVSTTLQRWFPTLSFQDIVYDGIHFPPNMDTPNTVSKVLAQKPGKMKASKLRQGTYTQCKSGIDYYHLGIHKESLGREGGGVSALPWIKS